MKRPRNQAEGSASLTPLTDGLRELIRQSGMSTYELAARSGVDDAVISRFVRGERTITMDTADRLAVALKLQIVRRPGRSR